MDLGKQLLESAREGHTNKVHDLICRGASFRTDSYGYSALHMAAQNNHHDTCEVLLRAGISKDPKTKLGKTPLHLAVFNGHEKIVKLLLSHKCDVNAKDMIKHTPLHWAVEEDHPNLVLLLLKNGADPCSESKFGETPITIATQLQFDDLVEMMSTYKHQSSVSIEEQHEATNSLMQEMERDSSFSQDSSPAMINSHSSSIKSSSTLQEGCLAVSCGRQIKFTEFGKQMIRKVQNSNTTTTATTSTVSTTATTSTASTNSTQVKNGDMKQKLVDNTTMSNSTTPKVPTKPNIVKRITIEEFNKLYAEGKVITLSNGRTRIPKSILMQKVGSSDSTGLKRVKVVNKSILNSSVGPAIIPPPATKIRKIVPSSPARSTVEEKFVQIPMTDYLEIKKQLKELQELKEVKELKELKELKERMAQLEERCGFVPS